ncbi:hypothetical protein SDRG_11497 [Saprolegnia diclina VS20]|uniref:Uncharacterized protein n=1 Tax=Saprolegnia diclina (strain VS20) TaxID=1156394 RepID=T0REL4_SAPDV|nr:hypothetical protein SDRG_11497 [Saprolegnia diclina VS20]EQC30738.1 hypothetical protein SDRG_11497 [Saprolegnia diclina VS20]|eukprot:XP_008615762.1 hypothetical protein SDRG_11497 [Saprolegnia diclina VS20]
MLSPRTISTMLDFMGVLNTLLDRHRRALLAEKDAADTLLVSKGPVGHQSCSHDRSEHEDVVCDSETTMAALAASLDFCQKRATADLARMDMAIAAEAIRTAKTRANQKAAQTKAMQVVTMLVHALATRNATLTMRLRHAQDMRLVLAAWLACGGNSWLFSTVLMAAAPESLRHLWMGLCRRWWRLVYGRRG